MRVVCINAEGTKGWLKEGEIYEPSGEKYDHCISHKCFILPEIGTESKCKCGVLHKEPLFNKSRFIPCSDIDETELIKERETQHA